MLSFQPAVGPDLERKARAMAREWICLPSAEKPVSPRATWLRLLLGCGQHTTRCADKKRGCPLRGREKLRNREAVAAGGSYNINFH